MLVLHVKVTERAKPSLPRPHRVKVRGHTGSGSPRRWMGISSGCCRMEGAALTVWLSLLLKSPDRSDALIHPLLVQKGA